MTQRVLFLSNGHGEDLNATLILQALRQIAPEVTVAAMPIVGEGSAYQRLSVPIIGPIQNLPSGGFNYINFGRLLNPVNWRRDTNPLSLLRDVLAGLIGLTWQQYQAVRRYSRDCDLLFVTGDVVPIAFAYLTQKPFVVFLVSTSSYYEGRARLPLLAKLGLRSRRCRQILTRDAYTAKDLQQRGYNHARFLGYPIMDVLTPSGTPPLPHPGNQPLIALLPGSRLPEAAQNLGLMLRLCEAVAQRRSAQFCAALVNHLTAAAVAAIAEAQGWRQSAPGQLTKPLAQGAVTVHYRHGLFADILHSCDLAVGMAGTAVEQAVGLGKPVVQIPGPGPQFTYLFAEAQMRLLGPSVVTVGTHAANDDTLAQAADTIHQILQNDAFRQQCRLNGRERVGGPGGAQAIAEQLHQTLTALAQEPAPRPSSIG